MNQAKGAETPSVQVGGGSEQHPPTAAMSQATQGGAASPQDAQSQTRGGPTAAQQAEGVSTSQRAGRARRQRPQKT